MLLKLYVCTFICIYDSNIFYKVKAHSYNYKYILRKLLKIFYNITMITIKTMIQHYQENHFFVISTRYKPAISPIDIICNLCEI